MDPSCVLVAQIPIDVEVRRFLYKQFTLPLLHVRGIKSRWGIKLRFQ